MQFTDNYYALSKDSKSFEVWRTAEFYFTESNISGARGVSHFWRTDIRCFFSREHCALLHTEYVLEHFKYLKLLDFATKQREKLWKEASEQRRVMSVTHRTLA